jgi:hypothetical protein
VIRVDSEVVRAGDGVGDVRDASVSPAADLVAEQPGTAKPAVTYGAFGDHTAVLDRAVPNGRHLDGVQLPTEMNSQSRVVEILRGPMAAPCGKALVEAASEPDCARTAGTER